MEYLSVSSTSACTVQHLLLAGTVEVFWVYTRGERDGIDFKIHNHSGLLVEACQPATRRDA